MDQADPNQNIENLGLEFEEAILEFCRHVGIDKTIMAFTAKLQEDGKTSRSLAQTLSKYKKASIRISGPHLLKFSKLSKQHQFPRLNAAAQGLFDARRNTETYRKESASLATNNQLQMTIGGSCSSSVENYKLSGDAELIFPTIGIVLALIHSSYFVIGKDDYESMIHFRDLYRVKFDRILDTTLIERHASTLIEIPSKNAIKLYRAIVSDLSFLEELYNCLGLVTDWWHENNYLYFRHCLNDTFDLKFTFVE